MPAAKPLEFRRRAVDLARAGDQPVAKIAKDLGISESCLRRWMAVDDVDVDRREGLTSTERKELVELRRRRKGVDVSHFCPPCYCAVIVEVADLARAGAILADTGVCHVRLSDSLVIDPAEACGIVFEFVTSVGRVQPETLNLARAGPPAALTGSNAPYWHGCSEWLQRRGESAGAHNR